MLKKKKSYWQQCFLIFLNIVFVLATVCPLSIAQTLTLPPAGTMVLESANFSPVMLKGLKVDPSNPFVIDFIVDQGDMRDLSSDDFKGEGERLIKYFLTAMTIPDEDIWVNLSPYESDHVIPEILGSTALGKDMLEQDYLLKQFAASLIHPDSSAGLTFWETLHKKAGEESLLMDSLNKMWIMPSKAVIYETMTGAYVVENDLKVATDFDYKALKGESIEISDQQEEALRVIQKTIIPIITKEVNEGKNFMRVRQMYNALLLAQWYKIRVQQSILKQAFVEQNKVGGDQLVDQSMKDQIYAQYLESFKKGVFNFIKEDYDEQTAQIVPRQYFSGGLIPYSEKSFKDGSVEISHQIPTKTIQENSISVFKANLTPSNQNKPSDGAEITLDNVLGNVRAIQEQLNINIENLNHLKFIGPINDIQFYEGSLSEIQGIGYGFDRKNQSIVVTPDFMQLAQKTLGTQENIFNVLRVQMTQGEKQAYQLAVGLITESAARKLFLRRALPEDIIANAKEEFHLHSTASQDLQGMRALAIDVTKNPSLEVIFPEIEYDAQGQVLKDVVAVNQEAIAKIEVASYSMGLRVVLGLVQMKSAQTPEDLQALMRAGEELMLFVMPSKWAPPTDAHSAFLGSIGALLAGVSQSHTLKTQTIVVLPNVTKKDNRKPVIEATFLERNRVTNAMLRALFEDTIQTLEPISLYENKNGEETVVELVVRLLSEYVNHQGAQIPLFEESGKVNADIIQEIGKRLPEDFRMRVLYQVGSDHYRNFVTDKQGRAIFANITDKNREDQVFWARLNPTAYKNLISLQHKNNKLIAIGMDDEARRWIFFNTLSAKIAEQDVLKYISEADYLPLLDTTGKYMIATSLFPLNVDMVLVHTVRGADYVQDASRDHLISADPHREVQDLRVLNIEGFSSPVAATFFRDGLRKYFITGQFDWNLLGIVPKSVLRTIFEQSRMIELLLRQDVTPTGIPKTFFPGVPEVSMSIGGKLIFNPQLDQELGLSSHDFTFEILQNGNMRMAHKESDSVLEYKIGIMYDSQGNKKNVFEEAFIKGNHTDLLNKMRLYAQKWNETDASELSKLEKSPTGGIDFDMREVNLEMTSDEALQNWKIDMQMMEAGDFDGLLPVTIHIHSITDIPTFLKTSSVPKEQELHV